MRKKEETEQRLVSNLKKTKEITPKEQKPSQKMNQSPPKKLSFDQKSKLLNHEKIIPSSVEKQPNVFKIINGKPGDKKFNSASLNQRARLEESVDLTKKILATKGGPALSQVRRFDNVLHQVKDPLTESDRKFLESVSILFFNNNKIAENKDDPKIVSDPSGEKTTLPKTTGTTSLIGKQIQSRGVARGKSISRVMINESVLELNSSDGSVDGG